MSWKKTFSILVIALLGLAASLPVLAHHGRHHHHRSHAHFGVFIGAPLFWHYPSPYYYYPPHYYPPAYYPPAYYPQPPMGVVPAPTTYIERGSDAPSAPAAAPAAAQDYWYYCAEAQAYYPYVKQCAKGWQRVPPQPPS